MIDRAPNSPPPSASSSADSPPPFDWRRLSDGRLHKLKRGVDYDGSTGVFEQQAQGAARRLGRFAVTQQERLGREDTLWVQFLDGALGPGEPCPRCESDALERVQEFFVRCTACRALHVLRRPEEAREAAGLAKAIERDKYRSDHDERYRMGDYRDVRFVAGVFYSDFELFYGRAVDPLGAEVLLWARYRLDGDPDRDTGEPWRVGRWPVEPFRPWIDLGRLPDAGAGRTGRLSPHDRRPRRLSAYRRVQLIHREELPRRERFFGHGLDGQDRPALIYVDYPLIDGKRVRDPDRPDQEFTAAYRWPAWAFGAAIDLASLAEAPGAPGRAGSDGRPPLALAS